MSNILSQISNNNQESPFDRIRHLDELNNEYWLARELMPVLGYRQYRQFSDAIERAIVSQQNLDKPIEKDFLRTIAKTSGRPKEDYRLSRLGCYLTAMNGDPRKPEIAQAQSYFAIKTREAEVMVPAQSDRIKELELQLELKKAEADVAKAQLALLEKRENIVTHCPEPVQQKLLGYQVVEKTEYRDRIYLDEDLVNDGSTVTKAYLCDRYGLKTKKGNPNYRALNKFLDETGAQSNDQMWDSTITMRTNKQFKVEHLEALDKAFRNSSRQMFLGE